jgi:hypothetical protein
MPVFYLLVLYCAVSLFVVGWLVAQSYRSMRDPRTVVCPETKRHAIVLLDAVHSTTMWVLGKPSRRVLACSEWPERRNCQQQCVRR